MNVFTRFRNFITRKRKNTLRLGLALGSGGAKGMAHLGALKAFEEEGIRFDVVAGTSIGSIVGALYAKGYSSSDMVEIVQSLSVKEFSKNLRPRADMGFAEEFLSGYVEGDISELPLPFAAWATDEETNEGVLLDSGSTARALTASSAMPPFFRAVEIGGKRLADGAFTNAIPADVARRGKEQAFPSHRLGDQRVCIPALSRRLQGARLSGERHHAPSQSARVPRDGHRARGYRKDVRTRLRRGLFAHGGDQAGAEKCRL